MDVISSRLPSTNNNTPTIEWVDPRELLHPGRLDIAVKTLYAHFLLGKSSTHSGINPEDAYLRHILFRTGGKEPGDEARKGSLARFKEHFVALVNSMQQHGFITDNAIPVARRTGLILNGAHRLATALALGLTKVPVIYHDDVDGLRWDSHWFIEQRFSPKEVEEFIRTWVTLRGEYAGCIILWPTVKKLWSTIERDINATTPIAYSRTIQLTPFAFDELVRDIYATDWGPIPGDNIEKKINFFSNHPPELRFLVVAAKDSKTLPTLKNHIREKWHHVVPSDRFATLHTTDCIRETSYVADLLLNRANLIALLQRPVLRPTFLRWLSEYFVKLNEMGIDPELCCVVGSSILEVHGIRLATDVDFTVTNQLREKLFTPGVTHLTDSLDVVSKNYPRAILESHTLPIDDDLIRDRHLHVRVRGLKFASLDVVTKRKQIQRRFKDLMDVALVSQREFEKVD